MVAAALGMLLVGSALAALPKAGKSYSGYTSGPAYNGYKPPVGFKVSSDGKRLLNFKYSSGDCGGMGGPGNPWASPWLVRVVGTIPVGRTGAFSVKNVVWKATTGSPSMTKYTYNTVNGHFATTTKAVGTITAQVKVQSSSGSSWCPKQTFSFTATAHY